MDPESSLEPDAGIPTGPNVLDVTDGTFVKEVIEESARRPVVVDLWAAWCAPCRTLGPILERLVSEQKGEIRLAKVDVDANPGVSAHFMVQGIPAVKAIVNGRVADEFVGSMPEPMVRSWLEPLLPTEADRVAAAAEKKAEAGNTKAAERDFRLALQTDPKNRDAALGLARLLIDRGDLDEAEELLEPLAPDVDAGRLSANIRVARWRELEGPGTLASAKRLAAAGKWREALDGMIASVADDPASARAAILDVFAVLGEESDLTRTYRGRLASALF